MLNSSNKIRSKSSEETIVKLREDYDKIEDRFGEFMTTRSMKNGIEVLDDMRSFFGASPAFISVTCEKIRRTHGPTFKIATVKAILNLRTDLTKDERAESLKICAEILDSFKNYTDSNQASKKGGIFSNLDIAQATKIQDSNDVVDNANDEDDNDIGINIDDFLKEGGINIDVLDPSKQ